MTTATKPRRRPQRLMRRASSARRRVNSTDMCQARDASCAECAGAAAGECTIWCRDATPPWTIGGRSGLFRSAADASRRTLMGGTVAKQPVPTMRPCAVRLRASDAECLRCNMAGMRPFCSASAWRRAHRHLIRRPTASRNALTATRRVPRATARRSSRTLRPAAPYSMEDGSCVASCPVRTVATNSRHPQCNDCGAPLAARATTTARFAMRARR